MPLHLDIKGGKLWDPDKECFYDIKPTSLILEHSLISVSKWESKYHKPFIVENERDTTSGPRNQEELLYYIECMTLTNNVDPNVYRSLDDTTIKKIQDYINDPMSATQIFDESPKKNNGRNKEHMTSELMYYYISAAQIPFSVEKWHLNRLLKLLEIASIKGDPDDKHKKMSARDTIKSNAALNAARKAKYHTKG